MSKITKRSQQALNTKEKLTKIAYDLFAKYSYKEVSIEMITSAAGMSKGSFYVHFKSKDALITELAKNKINEMDSLYFAFAKELPSDITSSEMLIQVCIKIESLMTETLGYERLNLMYTNLLKKTGDLSPIISHNRKIYDILFGIIQRGIQSGEFHSDIIPEELSKHLLISLRGLTYQWCVMYPEFDLLLYTENHISLLLKGIVNKG